MIWGLTIGMMASGDPTARREQWNSGIMGSGLRRRAYGSERIMQCWINGPVTGGIDDKIKMVNIL